MLLDSATHGTSCCCFVESCPFEYGHAITGRHSTVLPKKSSHVMFFSQVENAGSDSPDGGSPGGGVTASDQQFCDRFGLSIDQRPLDGE